MISRGFGSNGSMGGRAQSYFDALRDVLRDMEARGASGSPTQIESAVTWVIKSAREANANGGKLIFIGNGGSAAIASHMATDYSNNGGLRAIACNDGAALTCLANDYGYENVFAKQIEMHGRAGDILIAISSSGRSENILRAVAEARRLDLGVVTLSGFATDNPLRGLGDMNFYLNSDVYGLVELSHLTLCHAILDLSLGWGLAEASHDAAE